jgi:hypothetical protein
VDVRDAGVQIVEGGENAACIVAEGGVKYSDVVDAFDQSVGLERLEEIEVVCAPRGVYVMADRGNALGPVESRVQIGCHDRYGVVHVHVDAIGGVLVRLVVFMCGYDVLYARGSGDVVLVCNQLFLYDIDYPLCIDG